MKVKVLKTFQDKYTGEIYKAGETITVSKERFEEILTVDKLVEEAAEEVAEEQPKKSGRKKKTAE